MELDRISLAKRFWNNIFGDDMDFLDRYFDTYYKEDGLIISHSDNKVRYMTLLIDYNYKYYDSIIPIVYLTGLATSPELRGQGLMRENMSKVFDRIKEKNIPIAVLIPANDWLKEAYLKYGFIDVFTSTPPPNNHKSITHCPETYKLYKDLGYDITKLENHSKGMLKIMDREYVVKLYNQYHKSHSIPLDSLSDEDLTRLVFEDSFMNLMFDV